MGVDFAAAPVAQRHRRWYERTGPSVVALISVLLLALLATDTMGFLSTDVGGKLATLEAMHRNGTLSPDLGYWAESADPDGSLYPMWSTTNVDGGWVNVTTLPMLLLALPLYSVGGAFAAGLIPLLGTVAAALGARALARQLGDDGVVVFWIVGVASPLTVYALDFWEHSLGVALVVWAVVGVLGASRTDGSWTSALLAGLAFGLAAAMRQEALIYGFVAGCALGVRLLLGGRPVAMLLRGGALTGGFALTWMANAAIEATLIGDATRSARSTGTALAAGSDVGVRVEEAIITLASAFSRTDPTFLVIAGLTVGVLIELGRRIDRPEPLRPMALAGGLIGGLLALDILAGGLGFVPGLAASTPVAALGVTRIWRNPDHRLIGAIAVGSLPLIFAVQYTGGALPQWGGRYLLPTGTLLIVLSVVVLDSDEGRRIVRQVAGLGLAVTLIGVGWTIERSHSFADASRALADRDEPVLVFADSFLSREAGALVLDEQWLAAVGESGREEAADVLADLGIEEIGFVQHDRGQDPLVLPGWDVVHIERIPLVSGLDLQVSTQVPLDR
ncbi:MAG: hypothetical protein AAGC53_03270 [Actinomycetota bacterium]